MTKSKCLTSCAILLGLLFTTVVQAQQDHLRLVDPVIDPSGFEPDQMQPFIEPGMFNYDFQVFAPYCPDEFGDLPEPNTGFFFTANRMYINFPRPEVQQTFNRQNLPNAGSVQQSEGDWYFGNRFDLGYTTEEDHGWLINFTKIAGVYFDFPGSIGKINTTKFYNVDLNKTYRMAFHDGYLEPFFGARFLYLRDNFSDMGNSVVYQEVKNNILGFQVGGRYFKRKGRWELSGSARGFVGQNFQNLYSQSNTVAGATPLREEQTLDEFVPMTEFRMDAAYHVTRDLSLNVGLELMYFARGMVRGNPDFANGQQVQPPPPAPPLPNLGPGFLNFPAINDRDMTLAGVVFGIVWNR